MGIHQNAPNLNALMEEQGLPNDAIYYPEYDKALIGHTSKGQIVYDIDACIETLVNNNDMDYETASEHFWFNTEGAYYGEMTPVFLHRMQE